jgi:hypothetical protein
MTSLRVKVSHRVNEDNSKISIDNNPLNGIKMKKLKIVKNPLTASLNMKKPEGLIDNVYPHTTQQSRAENVLQQSEGNYFYNINKFVNSSKAKTIGTGQKSKLTFDNVFNNPKQLPGSAFIFPQNVNPTIIPPIIIGNMQNQPQISININNYNINNYSSSVNKSKVADIFTSPNKANNEPVRLFNFPIKGGESIVTSYQAKSGVMNKQLEKNTNSKIKLVKSGAQNTADDSLIILPHSNSGVIKKAKSVRHKSFTNR